MHNTTGKWIALIVVAIVWLIGVVKYGCTDSTQQSIYDADVQGCIDMYGHRNANQCIERVNVRNHRDEDDNKE